MVVPRLGDPAAALGPVGEFGGGGALGEQGRVGRWRRRRSWGSVRKCWLKGRRLVLVQAEAARETGFQGGCVGKDLAAGDVGQR